MDQQSQEGSYQLSFEKGLDELRKRLERISRGYYCLQNRSRDEVIYEVSDLLYHLIVLLAEQGITLEEIYGELRKRR